MNFIMNYSSEALKSIRFELKLSAVLIFNTITVNIHNLKEEFIKAFVIDIAKQINL